MKKYLGEFFPSGMPVDVLEEDEEIACCSDCKHDQSSHTSGKKQCLHANCFCLSFKRGNGPGELLRDVKDFKAGDSIQISTCLIKVDTDAITDMDIGVYGHTRLKLVINTTPDASFFVPDRHSAHHLMEFPSVCLECLEEERVGRSDRDKRRKK